MLATFPLSSVFAKKRFVDKLPLERLYQLSVKSDWLVMRYLYLFESHTECTATFVVTAQMLPFPFFAWEPKT